MTFDLVVVGAGLAGLTAGVRGAEQGLRVLVLARGVGATHLASAAVDVLGYAPERVESPERALPRFLAAHPDHPYARVGIAALAESLEWFRGRTEELGYQGGLRENLFLPSAVGAAKPSAVVPAAMAAGDLRPGGRFVFCGLRGLKDFYPAHLADNLARASLPGGGGIEARAVAVSPPLPPDERDLGPLGFARAFERREFRDAVVRELAPQLERGERVGFPAVLGVAAGEAVRGELEERLGTAVFEVPTLPPSVPGIRLFQKLVRRLRDAGGRLVVGGAVVGTETSGGRVEAVAVEAAARPARYLGHSFVLATGGFASGGLEMDSTGAVRETVFGVPVAGVPPRGEPRFAPRYLDPQPVSGAGLVVDEHLRPLDGEGAPAYENLHAAGATIAGAVPWREASGNGISVATGYAAAAAVVAEAPVLEAAS